MHQEDLGIITWKIVEVKLKMGLCSHMLCHEKVTWEPSSSLSEVLINEFETGIVNTEDVVTSNSYGVKLLFLSPRILHK